MFNFSTPVIFSGFLSLAIVCPAVGQAGEDPLEPQLDEQTIQELFQDLPLQIDDEADPRDRIQQQIDQLKAIEHRLIRVELQQQGNGFAPFDRPAEPAELEAQVYVNPWSKQPRDKVVAALGHEDFAERESALAFLLTDETLSKEVLKQFIQQAKSPEQGQRLIRVAEHHVLRELRERDFGPNAHRAEDFDIAPGFANRRPAAVGYSYEPVMAHENPYANLPGVRVIATMPGFPGHAYLRRGDIIVRIAGHSPSLRQQRHEVTNWVSWCIRAQEAGDPIDFTFLRDGQMLTVKLTCAEGAALDHMYTTDAFEAAARKQPYKKTWEQVREELLNLMPQPKTLTPKVFDPAE